MLRGKKPDKITKRFKALFYGKAGIGKTMTAIHFPRPYLIDTEKGAENNEYVELLNKQKGAILQLNEYDEILKEVKTLLSVKHPFKTLIIDPLTIIYDELQDRNTEFFKRISKDKDPTGTEFGKHVTEASRQIKNLTRLLTRLDMNVILTAYAKNEYGDNMKVLGQTFDCPKKFDHLFDLVLRVEKRGKERLAFIQKTRLEGFPEGEMIPFNYEEIAARYGREILEKDSLPEQLASPEAIQEIKGLIRLLNVPPESVEKWLSNSEANSFDEMSQENINKCIAFLKSKITNGETENV